MGYLISETTKEEREKIVAESLGNIEANCDGCMSGLAEMYQDYIDGKKEHGKYTGWTAQIIQHEVDHCRGVVI